MMSKKEDRLLTWDELLEAFFELEVRNEQIQREDNVSEEPIKTKK